MIDEKIKSLKIILPKAPSPVGSYVAYKVINNLVFISGQLPIDLDGKIQTGKIGDNLSLDEGKTAAYKCGLNIIAQLKEACKGDLNKVKNCIKITGFVNSTDKFDKQPQIINEASNLLTRIFDDRGKHTRAAVSVNSLPLNAAVEIDALFEIK